MHDGRLESRAGTRLLRCRRPAESQSGFTAQARRQNAEAPAPNERGESRAPRLSRDPDGRELHHTQRWRDGDLHLCNTPARDADDAGHRPRSVRRPRSGDERDNCCPVRITASAPVVRLLGRGSCRHRDGKDRAASDLTLPVSEASEILGHSPRPTVDEAADSNPANNAALLSTPECQLGLHAFYRNLTSRGALTGALEAALAQGDP